WITVSAPEGIGAGIYRGTMEILTEELGAIPIQIEVEVFDFTLPETPALKTDFGLDLAASFELLKRFGYAGTESALRDAYLVLGREGRVTLRETAQLPAESADYAAALRAFGDRLAALSANGVTTHGVP